MMTVFIGFYALAIPFTLWFYPYCGFWLRSRRYTRSLANQRIYHYVKHPYSVRMLPNGHVRIDPRFMVSPRGKDRSWKNVYYLPLRLPLSFFFVGRNSRGGNWNFHKEYRGLSASLVIIEGRDFVDFTGQKRVFSRWMDRSIATRCGYQGPAQIVHIESLADDRKQASDAHLDLLDA